MLAVERTANGRSVCMWSGRPLAVICQCGHRALIPLRVLGAHDGDMSLIYERPIVCSACSGKDFDLFVFRTPEEMDEFRATLPPAARPEPGTHSRG
jgi:hypothetical protein